MEKSQLELLQETLRSHHLRLAEDDNGELTLRGTGRQKRGAPRIVARRARRWLLFEQPVAGDLSPHEALRNQADMLLAKYVLPSPDGVLMLRCDLPLYDEVLRDRDRLECLLEAAMGVESPAQGLFIISGDAVPVCLGVGGVGAIHELPLHGRRLLPTSPAQPEAAAMAEAERVIREALADEDVRCAQGHLEVRLQPSGRPRTVSIELSCTSAWLWMPIGANVASNGDVRGAVGRYLLCLNGHHYLARASLCNGQLVAEVKLPAAGLTTCLCRLAVDAVLSFATHERALELLQRDNRVRRLYAAHHGLVVDESDTEERHQIGEPLLDRQRGGGPGAPVKEV